MMTFLASSATSATCSGKSDINIASFSLGRKDAPVAPDHPLEAVSVVETDQAVPDTVLVELLKNQAIRMARPVEFS